MSFWHQMPTGVTLMQTVLYDRILNLSEIVYICKFDQVSIKQETWKFHQNMVKKTPQKTRQLLKVMNVPAICNCDNDLVSTRLKCLLVLDIVTINICVKFNQSQFIKQH